MTSCCDCVFMRCIKIQFRLTNLVLRWACLRRLIREVGCACDCIMRYAKRLGLFVLRLATTALLRV